MKIAVVGGGINGLCCAWQLSQAGHQVALFEKGELMGATSAASSKLLHGGLRYLEQGELRLVHEALLERQWWLQHSPLLTRRLPILYPLYEDGRRHRWQLKAGMLLYDLLAGRRGIGRHRWLNRAQVARCSPELKQQGLKGAYLFFDGQMDDRALGLWVAEQCYQLGTEIHQHSPVTRLSPAGGVESGGRWLDFELVLNVAGPWSEALLRQSELPVAQPLDLVRGSHLLLPDIGRYGHMLEVPKERRIVFVLPYQGQTLLGTTEVRQGIEESIACSPEERRYLLTLYNHYFIHPRSEADILGEFAGLRPLLAGSADATSASREYALNWQGRLLTVSGGKWTTARALARKVTEAVAARA
ncbi:FAD-dependent oxidoreductase [Gallaecimonas sp. GXIMD4217]|uniref:glycerol-3-phosphate dehydrogenase/oxidase n=1 Tax=Gallaecimonas sp. GXIMD4217 TaxID=3131927 RepID=UPI00311ADCE2